MYSILCLDMFQYCTPSINSHILNRQGGQLSGSILLRTLSVEFKCSYATDVDAEGVEEGEDNSGNNIFKVGLLHLAHHTMID